MPSPSPSRIDWGHIWDLSPLRPFSAEEMRRAGGEEPTATQVAAVLVQIAFFLCFVLVSAPTAQTLRLLGALVFLSCAGLAGARWLWRRPWSKPLNQVSMALFVPVIVVFLLLQAVVADPQEAKGLGYALLGFSALVGTLWSFLVFWRAQRIEGRLAELAERERAIEMARRLASAQIEPHFLFNTLASLQHWVTIKDDRAATLLDALTGYLRSTLPMFARPLLPLADEIETVQRYLQVMQARLGARLTVTIEIDPALHSLTLPPAVLLTLAENAVQHGVEPRVRGGRVSICGRAEGGRAVFEVRDDGVGPPSPMTEGTGLANVRERLALTNGDKAQLTIAAASDGGCLATLTLPLP